MSEDTNIKDVDVLVYNTDHYRDFVDASKNEAVYRTNLDLLNTVRDVRPALIGAGLAAECVGGCDNLSVVVMLKGKIVFEEEVLKAVNEWDFRGLDTSDKAALEKPEDGSI